VPDSDIYDSARQILIEQTLIPNNIHPHIIDAMRQVPRHEFVPSDALSRTYDNVRLPLIEQQHMLSPLLVATMLQALKLKARDTILEIGTGSGYVTALLVMLGQYVYSLERSTRLAQMAASTLHRLGYLGVDVHLGDGTQGLADMAPFDAIFVSGAVPRLPRMLCMQLNPAHGRMVVAIGRQKPQLLRLIERRGHQWQVQSLISVDMPPLVGRYGFKQPPDNPASV